MQKSSEKYILKIQAILVWNDLKSLRQECCASIYAFQQSIYKTKEWF